MTKCDHFSSSVKISVNFEGTEGNQLKDVGNMPTV